MPPKWARKLAFLHSPLPCVKGLIIALEKALKGRKLAPISCDLSSKPRVVLNQLSKPLKNSLARLLWLMRGWFDFIMEKDKRKEFNPKYTPAAPGTAAVTSN
jgi:hypothetical protein